MKKGEMEVNVTYIICPEKSCKLFWNPEGSCPCDGNCNFENQLKFAIICHSCREIVVLPGNHHMFQRIDHKCPDGRLAANFRMSGKYHLLYKLPKR